MEHGTKVRIKNSEELRASPDWKYDPFLHYWYHITGYDLPSKHVGQTYTFDMQVSQSYFYVQEHDMPMLMDVLAGVGGECECAKEKFGFSYHEKWCPQWTPAM